MWCLVLQRSQCKLLPPCFCPVSLAGGRLMGCPFFFPLMPEEDSPFLKTKAEAHQSSNVLQLGRPQRESQLIGKEGREVSQFK